jgi:BirA family biotin operon repressor/biotin-[acetyl-CoA-carboxylase] ligase
MVARVQGPFATSAVDGTRFTDVRWVEETGSTNRDLLSEAAAGAPEGIVLVADHQTAGRGRLDRSFVAPPGASLLVSVLLRPRVDPEHAFLVTTAAAVAA